MPISYIGQAAAVAASVALPSFSAGDLAVGMAYRNGSITLPSANGSWTDLVTNTGANTNSTRIVARLLQAGDTTFGAFTNATDVQVHVLRGVVGGTVAASVGGKQEHGSNASPVTLNALTLTVGDGTSWVLCLVGAKGTGTNTITVTTAPALTLRSGSDTNLGCHSANGVTVFAGNTYDSQPSGSNIYRAAEVEILAAAAAGGETQAGYLGLLGVGV